jgi:hypothetical protein
MPPPSTARLVLFAAAAALVLTWLIQFPWGWTESQFGVCAVFTALIAMRVTQPW